VPYALLFTGFTRGRDPLDTASPACYTRLIRRLDNTTYIDRALTRLRQDGYTVREEDVARLSPLISEHINMLGRYRFALPEELAADGFRPLKTPEAAEAAERSAEKA